MFLSRWRPHHLLLSWIAYWITLPFIAVSPALPLLWRISGDSKGKGSIGVNFGNGDWVTTITAGAETWVGRAASLEIALWVALPPMITWIAWMVARPRGHRLGTMPPNPALHAHDPHRAGDVITPSKADERR